MRVAIVGAGVVGTLTAYYLHRRGCAVTVFDQSETPGSATSKANGGQLSYSFCDALADPALLAKLPGILLGRDATFCIRFSTDPEFYRWSLQFLAQCTRRRRDQNTLALLKLALRSRELMAHHHRRLGTAYDYKCAGKLVLLSEPPSAELRRRIQLKNDHRCDIRLVGRDEACSIEPTLAAWRRKPVAAVYSSADEIGDTACFTRSLFAELNAHDEVCFELQSTIRAIRPSTAGGCSVTTDVAERDFDAVVVCTGHRAQDLLGQLGIRLPILPMTGYSLTLPAAEASPTCSLTALEHRMVFGRMGDQVRIAGFADVNPRAADLECRAEQLGQLARKLAPAAADYGVDDPRVWHGHRAMTPSGLPILGKTEHPGIFLNVGHGMLGWTLAAATGEQVAALVTGRS